jgi:ABC-type Mn2+/Zn2+ transport system permease subunit
MILLCLITAVVLGPATYAFAPAKTPGRRLVWALVAGVLACALVIGFFVYIGDKPTAS